MSRAEEFIAAAGCGDLETVRSLLEIKPSLANVKRDDGTSAVLWACYHGQREIINILLAHGVELSIHEAAAIGQANRVAEWLDEDASLLDALSHDGWSALHLAAFTGQAEVVKLLLARGADTALRSTSSVAYGNTPLHAAVAGVQLETVELLLDGGAGPNARQIPGGYTPLHIAAVSRDTSFVQLLLNGGADPSIKADDGKTSLDIATEKDNQDVIAVLGQERRQ